MSCTAKPSIVKGIVFIPNTHTINDEGKLVEKPVYVKPVPPVKKPILKKHSKLAKQIMQAIKEQQSAAEELAQEYNDSDGSDQCMAKVTAYNKVLDMLREK